MYSVAQSGRPGDQAAHVIVRVRIGWTSAAGWVAKAVADSAAAEAKAPGAEAEDWVAGKSAAEAQEGVVKEGRAVGWGVVAGVAGTAAGDSCRQGRR